MTSILFVCVYNACRSQISEAICRHLAPGWTVASAGSNPSWRVDAKAQATLQRHGLTMSSHKPKGFHEIEPKEWDYVVGMGCGDKCPVLLKAKKFIEWDVSDPHDGPMEVYQALYENLSERVKELVQEIAKVS